ncbi:MAG: metallophosphoesterase [Planctomycetales bacterium]|nr:metallophosphoesterase [Planctomycetales bacterium]
MRPESIDQGENVPVRLLHISDLHFGAPFVPEVAEALLVAAKQLSFDAIVVSGDLTQRARRNQFIAAQEYLERFPEVPRLVIPGNHDVPLYNVARRLTAPHRLFQTHVSPDLNAVIKIPGATLVGLDSTAPRSAISNGRIHAWQLDFAAEAFADTPADWVRIVAAHHHFAPAPDYLHDSTMPKSKRAIMRFVDLEVDLILGGHLHRSYIGNSLDFYPGSHRERGIVIAQCGTSTSRRGRGREQQKNTFNFATVCKKRIEITHYMYFAEHGFIETSSHQFYRHASAQQPLLPRLDKNRARG